MVFDLRINGFTNCIIDDSLDDLSRNLPSWNTIPQTTTRITSGKTIEHFLRPLSDLSGKMFLPAYDWGKKLDEGTYGKIYQAYRKVYYQISDDKTGVLNFKCTQDTRESIVIKESYISISPEEEKLSNDAKKKIIEREIDILVHEATILTLAYQAVKRAHMEYSVPKVYEIFLHSKSDNSNLPQMSSLCISMEHIQGSTLLKYMNSHFKKSTKEANSVLFIDFIRQLAEILVVLQKELRMNHRDIKINNLLVRNNPDNPILVLIDFGFACVARDIHEPRPEMTKIEAGVYFGENFACFKKGRDMVQFLYSVHCHFNFEDYFTTELIDFIKYYMHVKYKYGVANLINGITTAGYHSDNRIKNLSYDEGIYIFLRRPEVDPIHCCPTNMLKDIEKFKKKQISEKERISEKDKETGT